MSTKHTHDDSGEDGGAGKRHCNDVREAGVLGQVVDLCGDDDDGGGGDGAAAEDVASAASGADCAEIIQLVNELNGLTSAAYMDVEVVCETAQEIVKRASALLARGCAVPKLDLLPVDGSASDDSEDNA